MIYCVTKPVEEYIYRDKEGRVTGIYAAYGHDPALLQSVLMMTTFGFLYEGELAYSDKLIPPLRLNAEGELILRNTLKQSMGGRTFREVLLTEDPLGVVAVITQHPVEANSLEFCQYYPAKGTFVAIVEARALEWFINYIGFLRKVGTVYHTKFKKGDTLQDQRVTNQMRVSYAGVKGLLKAEKQKLEKGEKDG